MNVLLIIFFLIILLCAWRGRRKGILLLIFEVVAWIFIFVAANYGKDYVKDFLIYNTSVQEIITDKYQERIEKVIEEKTHQATDKVEAYDRLPDIAKDVMDSQIDAATEGVANSVAVVMTEHTMNGISFYGTIIVAVIIVALLRQIVRRIGRRNFLGDVNTTLGTIWGLFEGMALICLIMCIGVSFPDTLLGSMIVDQCNSSPVLDIIYQNNPLLVLVA